MTSRKTFEITAMIGYSERLMMFAPINHVTITQHMLHVYKNSMHNIPVHVTRPVPKKSTRYALTPPVRLGFITMYVYSSPLNVRTRESCTLRTIPEQMRTAQQPSVKCLAHWFRMDKLFSVKSLYSYLCTLKYQISACMARDFHWKLCPRCADLQTKKNLNTICLP